MAKPILYSYFRSSCSWRVRIALELKNIDYEYRNVNILKPVEERRELIELNPLGTVPTLEIDGIVIPNSSAIIEYLDESRPQTPLLPKDPIEKIKVRAIADAIVSGIQPIQNVTVLNHINAISTNFKSKEWGAFYVTKGFKGIEKMLDMYSGKYCVGDELTLADLCLVPQVFNAAKYDVNMDLFRNIKRINEDLLKLEVFKVTHPFRQPDCPPELRID